MIPRTKAPVCAGFSVIHVVRTCQSLSMRSVFALLLAVTLWPSSAQVPAQPAEKLPRQARVLLDRQYKAWRFAPVKPAGNCIERMGPSPSQLTADFDQDG